MSDNYKFFSHKECEYFPCHKVKDTESFNCLFCYCPLYALGNKCGGNFRYNDRGIKDCTGCIIPHKKENYEYIVEKFGEISKIARQNKE
ncbi:cysteine-rich small domain-containing protein [Peptostreptococcus russellii]|uniref:cysteine-rich small domain-containing protein n=1 Tax=Peptostreptococcus russellii TaxID=215200 RepID=UPI003F58A1AE